MIDQRQKSKHSYKNQETDTNYFFSFYLYKKQNVEFLVF